MSINELDKYRHELKYVCSAAQIAVLHSRISPFLELDRHTTESCGYAIRSLYFDDAADTCFYENRDGVDRKEKFRIRIYNANYDRIQLELKKKLQGKAQKSSCLITEAQCRDLMEGRPVPMQPDTPFLLKKLCTQMRTRLMMPKVIVDYHRTPYVYRYGNVRITFDTNISSSTDIPNFLNAHIFKRPIMPKGFHILEVKFDEYLPDHILRILQLELLQQASFSKYYLCRYYSI